ncbi:sensor histidine kinase [Micromonospora sp. NPDC049679]|uniref:sensor histidine kinase n=1 Tax=Micromonospora sp. NPDC049679 TaxID=3155920 RepID=UPI0033C6582E
MDEVRTDPGHEDPGGEGGRGPARALVSNPRSPRVPAPAPHPDIENGHRDLTRLRSRRISHDIHHEMGTISLLATLLSTAPDVGAESRARALLILKEIRWLDRLQREYEECLLAPAEAARRASPENIRLDLVAAEVVEAIRLSHTTLIEFRAEELTAFTDRLAFWRVLRNVLLNAVRAAGPSGTVRVRISIETDGAVTHVEDDGPGFSTVPPRPGSLGLDIVQDLASGWGGGLEIRRGRLGGGCVRLRIPIVPPPGQQRIEGLRS